MLNEEKIELMISETYAALLFKEKIVNTYLSRLRNSSLAELNKEEPQTNWR